MMELTRAESRRTCRQLDQTLRLAGTRQSDQIVLVGTGIGALLHLAATGYDRACLLNGRSPGMAREADILVLDGVESIEDLAAALDRFGRIVRPGGTLVLREAHGGPVRVFWPFLARRGFHPTAQLPLGDDTLLLARCDRGEQLARAA
jgi:hypothetical protein